MPKISKKVSDEITERNEKRLNNYKKETEKYLDLVKNYKPVSKKVLKKFGIEMKKFFASQKFKK